jgi:hypothetical protein
MHFGQRDFSIYALDPSESDSAPNTMVVSSVSGSSQPTASHQSPPGVAVGMGLMSWALASPDDSALVTGIINKTASGESALEVVFALRGVQLFIVSCLVASTITYSIVTDPARSATPGVPAWRKSMAASDSDASTYAHAARCVHWRCKPLCLSLT